MFERGSHICVNQNVNSKDMNLLGKQGVVAATAAESVESIPEEYLVWVVLDGEAPRQRLFGGYELDAL